MEKTDILGLVEEMASLLENSKPVFGKGNLCQIDVSLATSIITRMRENVPSEIEEAKKVTAQRQQILADAQTEADRIVGDARVQAMTIASDQEIVHMAQQKADAVIEDARQLEQQTVEGTREYADKVFEHVEKTLSSLLDETRQCRNSLK